MNLHFLFCRWGTWVDTENGDINQFLWDKPETKVKKGSYVIQERTCVICGKKERRTAKSYIITI